MRVIYIATSLIPSRTANSIHVMKICNAMSALGHHVTLIVPLYGENDQQEHGIDDVYDFYGVGEGFDIKYGRITNKINKAPSIIPITP